MIESLIWRSARLWPNRIAVVDDRAELTFAELAERVSRLANALLGLGLSSRDRVVDIQRNSTTYIETELACAVAGLVRVPVNTRLSPREIVHIANDSGARAAILGPSFVELGGLMREQCERIADVIEVGESGRYEELIQAATASPVQQWPAPGDLVSINYSSGTTGAPKGCTRTIRNRISSMNAMLTSVTGMLTPEDCMLHVGPVTHASGLFVLPHLACGARQVLAEKFDAERFIDLVCAHQATTTVLVPTMLERVVDLIEEGGWHKQVASLKRLAYAGSPMAPDRIERANETLGGRLVQFYGMVEAIPPLSVLSQEDHRDHRLLRSAGLPVAGVAVRIIGEDGKPAPPGVVGEISVGGDHVMRGYWSNSEAATKAIQHGGWLRTGDLGCIDESGYLYLMDRRADMIISGGFNIMPREIEDVLIQHDGVSEAAVVGIPDREWGELVVAFVAARGGDGVEEELRRMCAEQLAAYKKPKRFVFLPALPKGSTGKVSRKELRTIVAQPERESSV